MKSFSFLKDGNIKIVTSGTEVLSSDDLIAITVTDLVVNTRQFHSKDRGVREGFIELAVGNQRTRFSYSGEGEEVRPKFFEKVVFIGESPSALPVSLRMMEVDEQTRKGFDRGGKLLSKLSGSPVRGLSPFVEPAAGAIGSILSLLETKASDNEEVLAMFVYDQELKHGMKLKVSSAGSKLQVELVIERLGTFQKEKSRRLRRHFSLRLSGLQLDFALSETVQAYDYSSRQLKRVALRSLLQRMPMFNIEAVSGGESFAFSTTLKQAQHFLDWQKCELWQSEIFGLQGQCMAAIPLTLHLTLNPPHMKAEEAIKLVQSGLQSAVRNLAAQESRKVIKSVENLTKGITSSLGILSEIGEHSLAVNLFDGVAMLGSKGSSSTAETTRLAFLNSGANRWTSSLKRMMTWRGRHVGSFSCELEIRLW